MDREKDFRYSWLPNWFSDFWNYPRLPALNLLQELLRKSGLSSFNILLGPPGSGKSISAYAVGRWASCKEMSDASDTPCGTCEGCLSVRYGGDEWFESSFCEIAPAEYESPDAALRAINAALAHVEHYGRCPGWDGKRPRNLVLLINEAHRLTKPQKASLLTQLESLKDVHVLATTTDIKHMQIEPDRPPKEDPLISRGDIFRFDFPTLQEIVRGLMKDGSTAGIEITEAAAHQIALRNRVASDPTRSMPRGCLADLYKLSRLGEHIDIPQLAVLADSDGDIESTRVTASAGASHNDGDIY